MVVIKGCDDKTLPYNKEDLTACTIKTGDPLHKPETLDLGTSQRKVVFCREQCHQ